MSVISKNVLIVGSKADLVDAFHSFDSCRSWQIDHCSDSFSALQRLKQNTYDVLIMDHGIAPLDPFKLMDYVFHELKKSYQMVIVGDGSEPEEVHQNYIRFNYPIEQHNLDMLLSSSDENAALETEKKVFSLDYLNELSDNNQEFLEESILLFRNTLDTRLAELSETVANSDFEEARQIAHNIKPSFAMLGNEVGPAICHTICYDATEKEIPKLTQDVINEYKLIINEIDKQFPKLKVI